MLFSAVIVIPTLVARYKLADSPLFEQLKQREERARMPSFEVFKKHAVLIVLLAIVSAFALMDSVVAGTYLVSSMHFVGIPLATAATIILLGRLGDVLGVLLSGPLADLCKRRGVAYTAIGLTMLLSYPFVVAIIGRRILPAMLLQQPFSWKSLGVDLGGSTTLKINYRTSHQIPMHADKLLGPSVSDVDGNSDERKGTISVFNGAAPSVQMLANQRDESKAVGEWLAARRADGVQPHEMGVFVRSAAELGRAQAALSGAGLPCKLLDDAVEAVNGRVAVSTMHLAKGLEFRAVAVMACDDEVIPLQERIEMVADESDLEEVYNTERQLLYVACTRARDYLLVTGVEPASEFLGDLRGL